jgi:hypothetical protein
VLILRLVILIGCIRLLLATDKPIFCAVVYTLVMALFRFAMASSGTPPVDLLGGTLLRLLGSVVYCVLLARTGRGLGWWILLLAGGALVLF